MSNWDTHKINFKLFLYRPEKCLYTLFNSANLGADIFHEFSGFDGEESGDGGASGSWESDEFNDSGDNSSDNSSDDGGCSGDFGGD